tara:strand:+ start:1734 stop:1874 length:141 start_codon:yes stop_codon:yes gene_type:complete
MRIKEIIQMLNSSPLYGICEEIDIAKGKNKMPSNFGELNNYIKRNK